MGTETVARYLYGEANGSHNPQSPAVLVYEDPAKSPLYRRSHVGDKR